jgi:hypothetical protein
MIFPPDFLNKVKSFFAEWGNSRQMPAEKRQIVFIGIGGGLALLIITVIIVVVGYRSGERVVRQTGVIQRAAIPAEELFLPDEPDFVPGVLLEREQRSSWTEQDAAVYWRDPLENGEEERRENVEAAIDALLERVP